MRVPRLGTLYTLGTIAALIILLESIPAAQDKVNVTGLTSHLDVRAQTACEANILSETHAYEVFSGKAYDVLIEVARAYRRPTPHMYILPGSLNMVYIAASTAVDGQGKILVGQYAIELFDATALKGFMGHEMAHLVSDTAAQGCNDYFVRDPQLEANADALAARTLGKTAVQAFLKRVLVLTEGKNWDAKHRLELLEDSVPSETPTRAEHRLPIQEPR